MENADFTGIRARRGGRIAARCAHAGGKTCDGKGKFLALPLALLANSAGPANFDDRLLALSVARLDLGAFVIGTCRGARISLVVALPEDLHVGLGFLAGIGQPGDPPRLARGGEQVLHAIGALPGEMADVA